MKTTIDIPDEVLHRAKVLSAQRKTTLKSLIISGLTHELEGRTAGHEGADSLIEALSKGRNNKPVGKLDRHDIYDRSILH